MGRRRFVNTKISADKDVNRLAAAAGDFAALLYTWMIPHAEDDCSLPNDAGEIKAIVVPWRDDKSVDEVEAVLAVMANLGLIWRYPDEGVLRFPPETFYKHQSYIPVERRWSGVAPIVAQNSAKQRKTAQNSALSSSLLSSLYLHSPPGGNQCATASAENCDDMCGAQDCNRGNGDKFAPAEKHTEQGAQATPGKGEPYEAEFLVWWSTYPRHVNKAAALKAYRARRRAGMTAEELATANQHHATYHAERGTGMEYIPHATTFLNGRIQEWLRGPPEGTVSTPQHGRVPRGMASLQEWVERKKREEDKP